MKLTVVTEKITTGRSDQTVMGPEAMLVFQQV